MIPLIEKQSTWKYFDQGSLPSTQWNQSAYDDSGWPQGPGKLGYGENDENTVVSFGPSATNKFTTTYFRKTINVTDTIGYAEITGGAKLDDGAIVYLNGVEIFRDNLPPGAIEYSTFASSATVDETSYKSFVIPKGVIKLGDNVVAVEVHQSSASSSDLSFDLQMSTVRIGSEIEFTTEDPLISDQANSDLIMQAVFEPIVFSQGIVINEISARPSSHLDENGDADDWIELYNTSNEAIDIAGYYITDNLAMKTKYKIPAGPNNETVIQPGGYKILWADEEPAEGALHVNIKLSAEGEAVGLYQDVEGALIMMDETTYDEFDSNQSYSRLPNGSGAFKVTTILTPMAANEEGIPTAAEENLDKRIQLYPNPSDGNFVIVSPYPLLDVEVINATGKSIRKFDRVDSGRPVSISEVPSGIYLVRMKANGQSILRKVVKH